MIPKKQALKKYWVKVSRPVIQMAIVQVEAENHEQAESRAMEQAEALPSNMWRGDFDPDEYGYDVVGVLDETDLKSDGDSGEWLEHSYDDGVRYLLLRASTNDGSGAAVKQPWFENMAGNGLLTADVSEDWLFAVAAIYEHGVDGFQESLLELMPKKPIEELLPFLNKRKKGK